MVFLAAFTLFPIFIHVHPHNWSNLKTEIILDDKGQVRELLQRWTFDIYYSAIRLADTENGHNNKEQDLRNLKNYHYFSELKIENR